MLLWLRRSPPRAAGFMAGRRLGGSVVRNRARRRLREAFRLEKHRAPASGVRICLVARRGTLTLPFPALRATLGATIANLAGPAR